MGKKLVPFLFGVMVCLMVLGCGESDEDLDLEGYGGDDPGEMVEVPEGAFIMGSDPGEGFSDELPERSVRLGGFFIDRAEVTNARYRRCVLEGVCEEPLRVSSRSRTRYYMDPAFDDYPVINITWHQAAAYCQWADKRLPTEAEWEKAARGPSDERPYPWGIDRPDCDKANFGEPTVMEDGTRIDGCVGDTAVAGSHPFWTSYYGVLDMAGNVAEWIVDWYAPDYYETERYPDNLENPQGPEVGGQRVVRGGSFMDAAAYVRLSFRGGMDPDSGSLTVGFRCAADL